MKFFFDRTLSPHLAAAAGQILTAIGHGSDHSRKRYPADPGDKAWMQALGVEGNWIVITGDQRIFKNPAEKKVWREAKMTTYFLQGSWQNVPIEEQAWRLMRWLPDFVKHAGNHDAGTGLSVPLRWHGGRLQQLYRPAT